MAFLVVQTAGRSLRLDIDSGSIVDSAVTPQAPPAHQSTQMDKRLTLKYQAFLHPPHDYPARLWRLCAVAFLFYFSSGNRSKTYC
jgi:hypothetical protein